VNNVICFAHQPSAEAGRQRIDFQINFEENLVLGELFLVIESPNSYQPSAEAGRKRIDFQINFEENLILEEIFFW